MWGWPGLICVQCSGQFLRNGTQSYMGIIQRNSFSQWELQPWLLHAPMLTGSVIFSSVLTELEDKIVPGRRAVLLLWADQKGRFVQRKCSLPIKLSTWLERTLFLGREVLMYFPPNCWILLVRILFPLPVLNIMYYFPKRHSLNFSFVG